MRETPPVLTADRIWTRVNGGLAYADMVDWDLNRAPVLGEHVVVSDGGSAPVDAVVNAREADGTIALTVPAYGWARG